jgi:hypothetical protein
MALVKYNNNSISAVTSAASIPVADMVHIKTLTASSSATLSFVNGSNGVILDSTYPIYVFEFINMHPATDGVAFEFNLSIDGGSNYNVTKTTTNFGAFHSEDGSSSALNYDHNRDLAQSTAFQTLFTSGNLGNGSDESTSGQLKLFNPSSTTFVKHFMSNDNYYNDSNYSINCYIAGYGNTTSAVNAIRFQMSSGNIDAGTIKLYGIKDS